MLAFVLSGFFSASAFAERGIDLDRSGSVAMSCTYQGKPVSGGDLRLYRVADVEEDDGNYYFRLLPELLEGGRLDQKALEAPDLAKRIAASPKLGKAEQTAVFDAKGQALFSDLKPGLYLLIQEKPAVGYEKMLPVLVSLPWYDTETESYLYDIDATVKPETARNATPAPTPVPKPDPKLPQTGQLKWPVPVLAACGFALLLLGTELLVSDRSGQRKEERNG